MMEFRAQKSRLIVIFAGGAALVGLVVLSFLDIQVKQRLHTRGRFHALGHFCVFSLVEILLAMGARTFPTRMIGASALAALGCVIEAAQYLIYGQPLETLDIQVDALGVVVGLLLVLAWDRMRTTSYRNA
jgi:hypothetical protein